MKATSLSSIAVVACLGLGGAYAVAQPKAPPKPGNAAPAKPSEAAKPDSTQGGGMMMGEGGCPMHGMASIADAKVEETPQGAVLRLTAKRPEDVAKVRDAAQRMIGCMSGGACMMHGAQGKHGGMMMKHGGDHHHHHGGPQH